MADDENQGSETADAIKQWLGIMSDRIGRVQKVQNKTQRQSRLITLVIIVQLVIWLGACYLTVSSNFSGYKVKEEFGRAAGTMWNRAKRQVRNVRDDVLPVYRDQAIDMLDEQGPSLSNEVGSQLVKFGDEFPQRLQKQVKTEFEDALESTLHKIDKNLGAITSIAGTDEERTQLETLVRERLRKENMETVSSVSEYLAQDTDELKKAIDQFRDLEPSAKYKDVALDRQLMHFLILWLDQSLLTREEK